MIAELQNTFRSIRWRSSVGAKDTGKPSTSGAFYGSEEESVYVYLRPLVALGSILGLLPLPSTHEKHGPENFRWLSPIVFYSFVIHILFVCGVYYGFTDILNSASSQIEGGQDQTFINVFMVIAASSAGLSVVLIHVKASSMGHLYQQLKEVERALCHAEGNRNYGTNNKWFQRMSYVLIFYLVLCVIINMLPPIFLYLSLQVTFITVVAILNSIMITISGTFPLIHCAALCFATSTLYAHLNKCIDIMSVEACGGSGSYFNNVNREQMDDDVVSIKVAENGRSGSNVLLKLERFRKHHRQVSELTSGIAQTFTPSFLVITPAFFVLSCYNFYDMWTRLGGEFHEVVLPLLSAVVNLISLSILAWSVDYLRSQHESTAEAVHSCRTDTDSVDDSAVNALQLFSLQLLHSVPQLSVAGFFAVDRTFILAMIGNLATYLVIFVQFRQG